MKIKKWTISLGLLLILSLGCSMTVVAATNESESNDTLLVANTMVLDEMISGVITEESGSHDNDCYKLVLSSTGHVTLNVVSNIEKMGIFIYDGAGNRLEYNELAWNSSLGTVTYLYDWYLEKGTYYIEVSGYKEGEYNHTGTYTLYAGLTSSNVNTGETNHDFSSSAPVNFDTVYHDCLTLTDNKADLYKITVPSAGLVSVNLSTYLAEMGFTIYQSSGTELINKRLTWNENVKSATQIYPCYLEMGTYYIKMDGSGAKSYYGNYDFSIGFVSSNVNHLEPNHALTKAAEVAYNVSYNGALTLDSNDGDWFKVTVPKGKLLLDVTSYTEKLGITVCNSAGLEIDTDTLEQNAVTGKVQDTLDYDLEAGTCYIKFSGYKSGSYNCRGNYSFKLTEPIYTDKISLNYTSKRITRGNTLLLNAIISPSNATFGSVTWESSDTAVATVDAKGKVTTKTLGSAVITAKASDGSGKTATCTVYSKLPKPSIYTVKSKSYDSVYLLWSAVSEASYYEVYCATSKTGTYNKVKSVKNSFCTISKRTAGKTYYYKVMAIYPGNNGKCSSSMSGEVSRKTVPSAPSYSVTQITKSKVKIVCAKVNGATGYQIYMKTGKKGTYKKIKTYNKSGTFTYKKAKLKNKTTYYYRVRAYRMVNGKKVYGDWEYKTIRIATSY